MKKVKIYQMKFTMNKKKRIYNALKNSDSEAVLHFNYVIEKIING